MLLLTCCIVLASVWLGIQWWPIRAPMDYEECSERAANALLSKGAHVSLTSECDKRFVGRRKRDGGYTYFDFMQNRHFDIAGPNPSPEELKRFDEEYTVYLDAQRRHAIAAAFADGQKKQTQIDFQNVQQPPVTAAGPPLVITPKNLPAAEVGESRGQPRPPGCDDGSLACSWSKLSAGVKSLLGTTPKGKRYPKS
jgi:hypothetical protein